MREYDFLLINDNFEKTLMQLLCVARTSRTKMTLLDSGDFLSQWANID